MARAPRQARKVKRHQIHRFYVEEKWSSTKAIYSIRSMDRPDPYLSSFRREMFGLAYLRRNCASLPLLPGGRICRKIPTMFCGGLIFRASLNASASCRPPSRLLLNYHAMKSEPKKPLFASPFSSIAFPALNPSLLALHSLHLHFLCGSRDDKLSFD